MELVTINQVDDFLAISDSFLQLDQSCFVGKSWDSKSWQGYFEHQQATLIYSPDFTGFIFFVHVLDEAELFKVGVDPAFRKKGLGSELVTAMEVELAKYQVKSLFLEVRETNQNALFLYQKRGFEEVGKRKNYYKNPTCSALLMSKKYD
ncbi:MAG: ribosomal-protein-alanine N-acetyltransferase [bacterium]|jgi:ribosomal-protein-alanine N-acetyltransferase